MYRLICVLVLFACHGTLAQEDCVPDPVDNITLSLNYVLSWSPSTNCEVVHYVIYIHSDDNLEFLYQAEEPRISVSFLPACERYRFTIMAFDQHMSSSSFIYASIPAPPGANLTMRHFTVTQQDDGVLLEWGVDSRFEHCAQFYRIIVWDYETAPRDIYTTYTDVLLDSLVPCKDYEFGVMAIYNIEVEGPAALHTYVSPPVKVPMPTLQLLGQSSTSIILTWALPTFEENPCLVTAINVDGSPNFNRTFAVADSNPRRPVTVTIGSLRPDTMYMFRVSVVNSAGVSDIYPLAAQTLPST